MEEIYSPDCSAQRKGIALGVLCSGYLWCRSGCREGEALVWRCPGSRGDAAIAGQVTDGLKNDMRLSGYFSLAPVSGAEYVQSGSVRGDHNGIVLECIVMEQATKRVALSKAYQGSAQDVRRVVHKLSDDIVQATTSGQRGIAQTKIAFVWLHNGAKELGVMDYDGYNVRQLTYDRSISVRPRWSPDGRKMVNTTYKKVYPDVLEVDL